MQSSRCIYRGDNSGDFGAKDCCEEGCKDQWWYLDDPDSPNDDCYKIKHTQRQDTCMYSNEYGFHTFLCDPWPEQYWTFEPHPSLDSYFRIKNNYTELSKIMYFIIYIFPL